LQDENGPLELAIENLLVQRSPKKRQVEYSEEPIFSNDASDNDSVLSIGCNNSNKISSKMGMYFTFYFFKSLYNSNAIINYA
jgi:hypothetical protein